MKDEIREIHRSQAMNGPVDVQKKYVGDREPIFVPSSYLSNGTL